MSWSHGLLVPPMPPPCIARKYRKSLLCLLAIKIKTQPPSFCTLQGATPTLALRLDTSLVVTRGVP
jgi:hypothetical protein